MRTWLPRIAALLIALVLLALLVVWLVLRASVPTLDGERALAGLGAPTQVTRDALGVATIEAASATDAARALGYVHAQERWFEMDLLRRSSAGELSALFGPLALDADRQARRHRLRARIETDLAGIAGDFLPQLEAYAEGANAGLEDLGTRPWPYLLLRRQPEAWTAVDSILAGYAMYFDLQGGRNERELALWNIAPHLPPALRTLLAHDGSEWDAPLMGTARGNATLPGPSEVDLRRLPAPEGTPASLADAGTPGSNNFAVSGALTADGRAIVADDMHLGLRAPNVWFRARLRWPDPGAPAGQADVSGFTMPGLPAVIVGSNGHVAWGFTNSYGDYMDWRLETPCPVDGADDGCAPAVRHMEQIEVAGGAPVAFEVLETAWGPVMHTLDDGRALSLRWVAHLPGAINLGLADLALAADLDQALAAASHPGAEFVVTKLDRLARSIRDAKDIADQLVDNGAVLQIGRSAYDPNDAMGKMMFNIMATFAEFEADLIRQRTREGMAVAKARGRLKGKKPKLPPNQEKRLVELHATGEHSITELAADFGVSRATVHRAVARSGSVSAAAR